MNHLLLIASLAVAPGWGGEAATDAPLEATVAARAGNGNSGHAPSLEELRVGARVITDNGHFGRVRAIVNGGRFALNLDNKRRIYYYYAAQLASTNGCDSRVCVTERVITNDGHIGNVIGIFRDGRLALKLDSKWRIYYFQPWDLAKTKGCATLCVGDRVITNNGHFGTVIGFFGDSRLALNLDNHGLIYYSYPWELARLGGAAQEMEPLLTALATEQ